MLVRDPGLPYNLGIIPSVPIIKVTSSRTKLHLAATRALAAREDVKSFGLSLPSPTTDLELMELMTWTAPRLTCLEIQQVLLCESQQRTCYSSPRLISRFFCSPGVTRSARKHLAHRRRA